MLQNIDDKVSGSCVISTNSGKDSISCHVTKNTTLLPYKSRYAVVDEKDNCIEIGLGWGEL